MSSFNVAASSSQGRMQKSDRSGYAARREVSKDAYGSDTFFVSTKKVSKEIDQGGPQSPQVGVPLWNPLPKFAYSKRRGSFSSQI